MLHKTVNYLYYMKKKMSHQFHILRKHLCPELGQFMKRSGINIVHTVFDLLNVYVMTIIFIFKWLYSFKYARKILRWNVILTNASCTLKYRACGVTSVASCSVEGDSDGRGGRALALEHDVGARVGGRGALSVARRRQHQQLRAPRLAARVRRRTGHAATSGSVQYLNSNLKTFLSQYLEPED